MKTTESKEYEWRQLCIVSGHSSGGILAASIAAKAPKLVTRLVLEDPPFFKVEPCEMQNTFVWHDGFKLAKDFREQSEVKDYFTYYFQHGVIWSLFGGLQNIVAKTVGKYSAKHPDEPIKVWYLPQDMLRGLYYQRKYAAEFGESFYNGSWFEGTNQAELLSAIECPCIYLKAKTAYLGEKGVIYNDNDEISEKDMLCCANDDADAVRITKLIKDCIMVTTPTNDHLIHYKYPKTFIEALIGTNIHNC